MTDEIAGKPRVPVEELREKVEEWRTMEDMMYDHWAEDVAKAKAYEEAANELEALIERYDYE